MGAKLVVFGNITLKLFFCLSKGLSLVEFMSQNYFQNIEILWFSKKYIYYYMPILLKLSFYPLKFIYSEKATKSPPIFCPMYYQSNNWWRFRKILWPSQNIWTLEIRMKLKWKGMSTHCKLCNLWRITKSLSGCISNVILLFQ